jgi:prepilin-type N-terminal cleavage/methylation domain-containing protein
MKGQTLIEVLVALGIISVVATALAAVVITSASNAQFSKNQNMATQYTQEGMEIVRRMRDSDYTVFRTYNSIYCLDKDSSILGPNCTSANIDNFFLRKVTITQGTCAGSAVSNVASITVSVAWQDGKCSASNPYCHASRLVTCLSTVNPVPTL